jgi:hypothetical protein
MDSLYVMFAIGSPQTSHLVIMTSNFVVLVVKVCVGIYGVAMVRFRMDY